MVSVIVVIDFFLQRGQLNRMTKDFNFRNSYKEIRSIPVKGKLMVSVKAVIDFFSRDGSLIA
jgi:hypothetical protein